MKQYGFLAALAVAVAACQTDQGILAPSALNPRSNLTHDDSRGAVYTLTNQASGNAVAVFRRAGNGALIAEGTVPTGGIGTGSGLGSQGALALSDNGYLLAVNAGSNDVSVFRVTPGGLALTSITPSGGVRPTSLTVNGHLVYVLNAGGTGNITAFTLDNAGQLTALAGSTRPLSAPAASAAQVSFSPDGKFLVVTERATNLIDVYSVAPSGLASGPVSFPSAGGTPFGFAFGLHNQLFVSEAAGSASSYTLANDGSLTVVSGAVVTNQGAPCWLVITKDGRFTYTANAQGGTISGFTVAPNGAIQLLDANGATAVVGRGAIDAALSNNSKYLYQLVGGTIFAFRVEADGHLASAGSVGGLPAGTAGLVAR